MANTKSRYGLLLIISFLWGSQFVFNKIALQSFSSITIAMGRASVGMLTLSLILFLLKSNHSESNQAPFSFKLLTLFFFIGLTEATLPFYLIAWGQHYVSSAIAAVLIGTIPIMVIILLAILRYEKITLFHVASVILGFLGIFVLFFNGLRTSDFLAYILGELAVLGGAFSFALSLILIKKLPPMNHIWAARNILLCASLQILPVFLFSTKTLLAHPPFSAYLSVLSLGVFCAGIAYVLYVKLVVQVSAAFASFTNYLIPLFGVAFGLFFFKEQLHWSIMISILLIFSALVVSEMKGSIVLEADDLDAPSFIRPDFEQN